VKTVDSSKNNMSITIILLFYYNAINGGSGRTLFVDSHAEYTAHLRNNT
jgi:hypothetical protein